MIQLYDVCSILVSVYAKIIMGEQKIIFIQLLLCTYFCDALCYYFHSILCGDFLYLQDS